ncbi:MAG: hypothetical protein ACT4PV_06520 [Planctomycetaceae bacterium]
MRIHCDVCGLEISKEEAVTYEEDGEILYYCSQECYDAREPREPELGDEPDGSV